MSRALVAAAVAAALAAPAAGAAWAPGSTAGAGAARAKVMPAGPTPGLVLLALGTVDLTWPAAGFAGGPDVAGYVVRRFNALSGVEAAVGGTCAGVVTTTGCTEPGVPTGSWTYSVTAAQGAWRGAEGMRVPIVVV